MTSSPESTSQAEAPPLTPEKNYRIGYTAQATPQVPSHTRYAGTCAEIADAMAVARHMARDLEGVHVLRVSDGAVTPPDEYDMPHWRKGKP